MITEIGALVSILKNLLDVGKASSGLFKRNSGEQEKAIAKLRERFEGLAEQLQRCMQLDRLIPVWEKRLEFFEPYLLKGRIEIGEATHLESELRDLIRGAATDFFSGAFFYTQYDIVPEVHAAITELRSVIEKIDHEITHIPATGWSAHWPQLAGRLRDLKNATYKVERALESSLAALFKELHDAAKQRV
ncbi:hypothetical protein [Bradyrhizobium sp.]|jgi:hypothetical protein|uniref:hypothetical protein n=1 Tax=Bradyrhizobium sp. TaxID=376 RepID=UPI002DFF4CD8|nr:hypothetical protein [Bradyrhizobium sp.]